MELMTIKDVARKLGVSENWVYSHLRVRKPFVRHVRLGGNIGFREADIDRWIEEQIQKRGSIGCSVIDFRVIGRKMPRRRNERGWVAKVGKIQKMWEGHFHVYVRMPDGSEKRREKTRIIGSRYEITKREAEDKLREIILKERGPIVAVSAIKPASMSVDATFAEVWPHYRALKEAAWSTATRKAVVSVFETASAKAGKEQKVRRPSITPSNPPPK